MIIVLEGIDGCGKGTQAKLLLDKLKTLDSDVGLIKFPDYETPMGKLLHDWLHGSIRLEGQGQYSKEFANALALQGIMYANRLERADLIKKYTGSSFLVVDRYWQSGVAYGSGVDGLDFAHMVETSVGLPQADLNIFIDIPVDTALERQKLRGRQDIYENRKEAMYLAKDAYWKLWSDGFKKNENAWHIVPGALEAEDIADLIWIIVEHNIERTKARKLTSLRLTSTGT